MLFKDNNTVSIYFSYINKYPLLGKKKEKKLGEEISKWRALEKKIERKRKQGLNDEEIEFFIEENKLGPVIQDGKNAFEKMIKSNLKLVVSIAKRFIGRSPHLKFLDLIQEGNIGLIKAIKKIDPARNCRLSTYATPWIKQALDRAVADNKDDIRLPIHINMDLNSLRKARKKLCLKLDREPTQEEISKEIKFRTKDESKLRKIKHLELVRERKFYGLEDPLPGREETALIDLIKDESALGPVQSYEKVQIKRQVREAIVNTLEEREVRVINLRFGLLLNSEEKSLEEVGKIIGVTRERVRQIEAKALSKLRKKLKDQIDTGHA